MYCLPTETVLQVKLKHYEEARPHAASAWMQCTGGISNSTNMFINTCKLLGLEIPADPKSFVTYWGKQHLKQGSIKGGASNSGRLPKLSVRQARCCLDVVLGWKKDGLKGPYRSVHELVSKSAVVKQIMESTNASPVTLTRAMKRLCPTLSYKKLTVKAKLTTAHKHARVVVCRKHLQVSDDTLETVVWIDAKTMYMNITDRYGWIDTTEEDCFETKRPATRKSNIIKLKYYIAVNARLGAVKLVFYTGTTGMPATRDGKTYLVSLATVQLWCFTGCNILHGLL